MPYVSLRCVRSRLGDVSTSKYLRSPQPNGTQHMEVKMGSPLSTELLAVKMVLPGLPHSRLVWAGGVVMLVWRRPQENQAVAHDGTRAW